jgi:hypothetical protein
MTELLAIPRDWDAPPRTLDDWAAAFAAQGHPGAIERDPDGDALEVGALGLRAVADAEGGRLVALHVELHAPEPGPARAAVEQAAAALGWEVHEDDDEDDD